MVVSDAADAADAGSEQGAVMQAISGVDGRISYDLEEFCNDYGHPAGQMFTLEVTHNAVTYVYADVIGTIHAGEVIFDLEGDDLVHTRKAH
jgi:hypothetical protein